MEISLYFHIPFCQVKCHYCHFYVLPDQNAAKEKLLEGFLLEIEQIEPFIKEKVISTIYFGGGTPSLFSPSRIAILLNKVRSSFSISSNAEITLEANPEDISFEKMKAYAKAGINRVSIGIQTLDPHLLKLLGRLHDKEKAIESVKDTYRAGIKNLSIDLMYDLPNQTLEHWSETLNQIQELPINHLSLYNLTIEPHTVFFKKQFHLRPLMPDEEISLSMYMMAIDKLEKMGLKQYEISAFARTNCASQHNSGYWTGRSFWGLGPSAFSYWEGQRFQNVANLNKYLEALQNSRSPIDFKEELNREARQRELFVIQLRLCEGIHMPTFTNKYGPFSLETLKQINQFVDEGYLKYHEDNLLLTMKGILFYDSLAVDLI